MDKSTQQAASRAHEQQAHHPKSFSQSLQAASADIATHQIQPSTAYSHTATPLLSINNLSIHCADNVIVDNLSFSLDAGQMLGVMAPSGQGKTTSMLALLGLLPDNMVVSCNGYYVDGQAVDMNDDSALSLLRGRHIGYLFQEPKLAMNPLHTVAQGFDTVFDLVGVARHERQALMLDSLIKTQLPSPKKLLSRYPHQLSGGEARRVSIAQLLVLNPRIIIADEPTSGLDTNLHTEIMTLLASLAKQETGVIIISHDSAVIRQCDQLLYISEKGAQFGDMTSIMANLPVIDYGAAPSLDGCHAATAEAPILSLQNLSISYPKGWRFWQPSYPVFTALNLQINRGEIVGVVGRSGTGKTSLARAIAHLADDLQVQGKIYVNAENLSALTGAKLRSSRRQVQLVMQDARASLSPTRTIKESLFEGLEPNAKLVAVDKQQQMYELLALCGLSHEILARLPRTLSGGECQRVCIVRALLTEPSLLILDEPTAMLDSISTVKLLHLLRKLHQAMGMSMILISHDRAVVDALCHQVVDLDAI